MAEQSLEHASDLAVGHAQRAFQVASEIAERADNATAFPDGSEAEREEEIHRRLSDMAAGLTSVVNASTWDANGAAVARSDAFPVNRGVSIADRAYFRELRESGLETGVSEVMTGRQSGRKLLNVTRRRTAPDGSFRGAVAVSLMPSYFRDYYRSLASEDPTTSTFMLVRTDGEVLARWPDEDGAAKLPSDHLVMKALSGQSESPRLMFPASGVQGSQLVAIKRLPDVPVAVVAGLSRATLLSNWVKFVGLLAAVLVPTTLGLVYVTWVALKRTRKEQAVSLKLQEEIHARGLAERKMLESQRLETLAFVTGGVAHDFNNLMAVISSSLHVFRKRRPDAADDKQLGAISRSVQSGVRLTRQLLSFSQKQALRPEVVTLQRWLPSVDDLLRSTLGSSSKWTVTVDADTRAITADLGELELALVNVVLNAKLAMPHGGSLRVHVSNETAADPDQPMVILYLVDTGEGISPDVLPKVFEPFFTTRQKGVGSGLGLSQVHGFCLQSGGRATIQSTLGVGTTVCLHLPAAAVIPAPAAEGQKRMPTDSLVARVLLVEDNEDVGATAEEMLRSSGATVVRVINADAALAYLASTPELPEVVLSDISMPGSMNGIGLALELRRLYPSLPIMLTTGYAEQMSQGTAMGMRVFQKPVPPEELLAELRSLVQTVRSRT